jgi:5-methyltetrahydropteroyltriglutamate--homocysteine methyltransferase
LPGVIDVTTNYLEHPEVVADRICHWVDVVVDRERVIASTDCGFGTFASFTFVAEDVCWAKLQMLTDGAKLASNRLWGRKAAA